MTAELHAYGQQVVAFLIFCNLFITLFAIVTKLFKQYAYKHMPDRRLTKNISAKCLSLYLLCLDSNGNI